MTDIQKYEPQMRVTRCDIHQYVQHMPTGQKSYGQVVEMKEQVIMALNSVIALFNQHLHSNNMTPDARRIINEEELAKARKHLDHAVKALERL